MSIENLENGRKIRIKINNIICECIVFKSGVFSVKENELVITCRSSGWNAIKIIEIF